MAKREDNTTAMPVLIKALGEGETYSRTRRVPIGTKDSKDMNTVLSKLRNIVNQGVSRVRKEVTGSNFRVESGLSVTDDKSAFLATVAVTRFDAADDGVDI